MKLAPVQAAPALLSAAWVTLHVNKNPRLEKAFALPVYQAKPCFLSADCADRLQYGEKQAKRAGGNHQKL
jgi:hypothetical protein